MQAIVENGDIICPYCKAINVTPIGPNPNTGQTEKMIVFACVLAHCNQCNQVYYLNAREALKHNNYWFPSAPDTNSP